MEARGALILTLAVSLLLLGSASAQLRTDFYKNTCPNVESLVRSAVSQKFQQTFVTAQATVRLFFHDCFVRVGYIRFYLRRESTAGPPLVFAVPFQSLYFDSLTSLGHPLQGCDASVMIASPRNNAEKDHPDDLSLAGDGFDTVIKAKAAVDSDPKCRNKVSCADILALATRDLISLVRSLECLLHCWFPTDHLCWQFLIVSRRSCTLLQTGGPFYPVELGRRDGRISTIASVQHSLPQPFHNLDQLNTLFSKHGLSQTDLVALSGIKRVAVACFMT